MSVGFLCYMAFWNFPADIDTTNYESALKNAFKFLGCTAGMWVVYEVDRSVIRFETATARPWAQVLKLVLGFALLLVVMEGTKPLLNRLFDGSPMAHAVRYFLTVLFAGCVWPLTFRFFARLGTKTDRTAGA